MFRSFYAAALAAMVLSGAIFTPSDALADARVVIRQPNVLVLIQFSAELADILDDVKRGLENGLGGRQLKGVLEIVVTRNDEMKVLLTKEGQVTRKEIGDALANEWIPLNALTNVSYDLEVASGRLKQRQSTVDIAVENTVVYIIPADATIGGAPSLPANLEAINTQIVVIQLTTPAGGGSQHCCAYEMLWNWRRAAGSVYMMIPSQELGGVLARIMRK